MSASAHLAQMNAASPLEKCEIDLFRFLPEIVAVVKAVEPPGDGGECVVCGIRAWESDGTRKHDPKCALVALTRKLNEANE